MMQNQLGGFVNSPANKASPSGGGGANKSQNTLMPMTVREVFNCQAVGGSDTHRIHGSVDLHTVSVCGLVLNVVEDGGQLRFALDDGTGRIDVCFWAGAVDPAALAEKRAAVQDGGYLMVTGKIVDHNQMTVRQIYAHAWHPITDMNSLTEHLLRAIYADAYHERAKSGALPAASNGTGPAFGGDMAPVDRVKAAIRSCPDQENGATAQYVADSTGMPLPSVQAAFRDLESEGLIYTTTDELHFKCC